VEGMDGFLTPHKDRHNHLTENPRSGEQRILQTIYFGTQSNSTLQFEYDALVK